MLELDSANFPDKFADENRQVSCFSNSRPSFFNEPMTKYLCCDPIEESFASADTETKIYFATSKLMIKVSRREYFVSRSKNNFGQSLGSVGVGTCFLID